MKRKFIRYSNTDYSFLIIVAILVVFGLVMLSSASSDLGKIKYGDSFYYLKHQLISGVLPGVLGFIFASLVNYKFWKKISLYFLILGIVLLLLVFTPLGITAYGSQRWINISGFSFQPAEIVKLALITYMASWLSKNYKKQKGFTESTLPFLIILILVTLPIFLQPATTTALLLVLSTLVMYLTAGANLKSLAFTFLVMLLIFIVLVVTTPYRFQRIFNFLHPQNDVLGKNYHLNQLLMAIGNGGLWGVGYGKSTTKIFYLPEPMSDSIFAVIGEELGFVGSVLLIMMFLFLIWSGIKIAKRTEDPFGRFFVIGGVALIGFQAFIHIASISGLLPPTGVPLPFISYGGTSLATLLTTSGIIFKISKG